MRTAFVPCINQNFFYLEKRGVKGESTSALLGSAAI